MYIATCTFGMYRSGPRKMKLLIMSVLNPLEKKEFNVFYLNHADGPLARLMPSSAIEAAKLVLIAPYVKFYRWNYRCGRQSHSLASYVATISKNIHKCFSFVQFIAIAILLYAIQLYSYSLPL